MHIPHDKYCIVAYSRIGGHEVVDQNFREHDCYEPYDYVIWYGMKIVASAPSLAPAKNALRLLESK